MNIRPNNIAGARAGRVATPSGSNSKGGTLVAVSLGAGLAILAGSNLSLHAFQIGGRYIPEPLLLAWFLLLAWLVPGTRQILRAAFRSEGFLIVVITIAIAAIFGLARGSSFTAVYGDARATLVFVVFLLLALHNRNGHELRRWEWLLLSLFIVACLLDSLRPSVVDMSFYYEIGSIKREMSFWATIGIAIIAMRWRSITIFAIALGFSLYFARVGFFRLYYVGPICISLLLLLTAIRSARESGWNQRFTLTLIAFFVGATLLLARSFYSAVDDMTSTESGRMHSIGRTTQFLEGLSSGDLSVESERAASLEVVMLEPWLVAVPYGIGWRDSLEAVGEKFGSRSIISTMDSGPLFIAFHYGVLVFYVIAFALLIRVIRLKRRIGWSIELASRYIVVALAVLNLLTEAGMFTIIPRAIQFSIVVGMCLQVPSRMPSAGELRRNFHVAL